MKKIGIRERFGGELVSLAQTDINPEIKIPTIYAMLRRQIRDGMLKVQGRREADGITRGTSRKYYELTTEGEEYLAMMEDTILDFSVLLSNLQKEVM